MEFSKRDYALSELLEKLGEHTPIKQRYSLAAAILDLPLPANLLRVHGESVRNALQMACTELPEEWTEVYNHALDNLAEREEE